MQNEGSAFRGFNFNSPSNVQATFDAQFNSYIAYSGWGVSEPSIQTAPISTTSSGTDAYGNPIVAYKFQTELVSNATVPSSEFAYYTWIISTGATNGQIQSTIKQGIASNTFTDVSMNSVYYNLLVNYTGSTNIPAGTYRVYTTKPGTGFRIQNNGNNLYFIGGTLV
jgi:hypothetical protein